jgi:putative restriction endonuclease
LKSSIVETGIALHDKAFDRGLITFDTELRLVCSPSLRDHFAEATVAQSFKIRRPADKPLAVPAGAAGPKVKYLEWHRREVFGK